MNKQIISFELTNKMLETLAEIMENLGKLSNVNNLEKLPRLRKVSRIKSIYSSLAIENNTLSINQVTDLINGKRVLGPEDDIIAVQNAFRAYKELDSINPYDLKDLLRIHKIMMNNLVQEAGCLRFGNVGVFNEQRKVIHTAPSFKIVKGLINELFDWVKNSDIQILIKSSIFHYEFEFIHPFSDGNGRMGRLWQTVLLSSWKPIFKYIPIESVIKNNQEEYYNAIAQSIINGKLNVFIIFMLNVINKSIKNILTDSKKHCNHINIQINKLIQVIKKHIHNLHKWLWIN